jgi:hypothetical protein
MAIEGTVKTPFGQVQKKTAVVVGVGAVGVVGIVWYRSRQNASSSAATTAATTTATTDPSIDPATGIPYAQEGGGGQGFADQLGSGGYYDNNGNWIPYSQQSFPGGTPGPGSFTSNPQWAQYVEDYLVNTTGLDANATGAAIGKYITGQPVTSDMVTIIQQAIAIGGNPPVAGTDGYPPSYHQQTVGPPPPPPNSVKVRATGKYDNVTGTWAAVSGATGYQVSLTSRQGTQQMGSATVTGTSHTFTGLPQKRDFAFHVVAQPGGQTGVSYTSTK